MTIPHPALAAQLGRPHRPEVDRERAVAAVRDLLAATGEDVRRPGLLRTPERVADLMLDLLSGVGHDPADALGAAVALDDPQEAGEVVGVTGITFRSVCEHHLLPFSGTADLFYVPDGQLAGFSRLAAVVHLAARRPQLQERLGTQIAEAVHTGLGARGVVVRITAEHGCLTQLPPHAEGSRAVTVATAGDVDGPALAVALAGST